MLKEGSSDSDSEVEIVAVFSPHTPSTTHAGPAKPPRLGHADKGQADLILKLQVVRWAFLYKDWFLT